MGRLSGAALAGIDSEDIQAPIRLADRLFSYLINKHAYYKQADDWNKVSKIRGNPRFPNACGQGLLSYNPGMETHLDKRFGFLISDVGRLCSKRFDELAKSSLDLTRAQCRALAYLSHFGDVNQARLADLLEVAPISAGRLLDRMEEGGWIERFSNPDDRRERTVRMTAKAEGALGKARRVGDAVAAEALAGLDADERAQLISLLRRVRVNLSTIVDE